MTTNMETAQLTRDQDIVLRLADDIRGRLPRDIRLELIARGLAVTGRDDGGAFIDLTDKGRRVLRSARLAMKGGDR